jgi:hypothetical protein
MTARPARVGSLSSCGSCDPGCREEVKLGCHAAFQIVVSPEIIICCVAITPRGAAPRNLGCWGGRGNTARTRNPVRSSPNTRTSEEHGHPAPFPSQSSMTLLIRRPPAKREN